MIIEYKEIFRVMLACYLVFGPLLIIGTLKFIRVLLSKTWVWPSAVALMVTGIMLFFVFGVVVALSRNAVNVFVDRQMTGFLVINGVLITLGVLLLFGWMFWYFVGGKGSQGVSKSGPYGG